MKQHMSVLMLLSRSTIYRILLRFFGMILIECGLFYLTMQRKWSLICEGNIGLEGILSESWILLVFVFFSVQVLGILSDVGCESDSKVGYTLRRLSVSEKTVVLWHWGYNSVCYLLLWWVQALTLLGLSVWYVTAVPAEVVNGQTIMLACYRSSFFHHLFPMADIWGWIRNLFLVVTFGLLTAKFPYFNRRGQAYSLSISCMLAVMYFGLQATGIKNRTTALMLMGVCLFVCVISVCTLLRGEDVEDEELPEAKD